MIIISYRFEDCRNWYDLFNVFEFDFEFVCVSMMDLMLLILVFDIVCVNMMVVDIGFLILKFRFVLVG